MYKIYTVLNNGEIINVRTTIYKEAIQGILQETVYTYNNFLYKENLVLGFFVKNNFTENNYFIVNYDEHYKPSINPVNINKKEFKKYIKRNITFTLYNKL